MKQNICPSILFLTWPPPRFHPMWTGEVTTQTIAAANTRYVVEIQCRDSGSPILTAATPATVRVDTFIPDKVIVK